MKGIEGYSQELTPGERQKLDDAKLLLEKIPEKYEKLKDDLDDAIESYRQAKDSKSSSGGLRDLGWKVIEVYSQINFLKLERRDYLQTINSEGNDLAPTGKEYYLSKQREAMYEAMEAAGRIYIEPHDKELYDYWRHMDLSAPIPPDSRDFFRPAH